MGWERTKATTMELPPEPSFTGWLLAGGFASVVGILLFILHASGMVKALAVFNIWWLASSPVLAGFSCFVCGGGCGEEQSMNISFCRRKLNTDSNSGKPGLDAIWLCLEAAYCYLPE